MSDDCSGGEDGKRIEGEKNPFSVSRYPADTDSLDTAFELLRDARRRYLLYYLHVMNGTVAEFEAAVNAVCEYEAAGTETVDGTSREAVRLELHHAHLPRLADADVVEYDRRQGTIRYRARPALEEWVEHARFEELDR